MRKTVIFAFIGIAALWSAAHAGEGERSIQAVFSDANSYYEKGEYAKALEGYRAIMARDAESGNLYYNMGNAYFKLDDLANAILYYERAKRLTPHDADLKSNLEHALSFVEDSAASGGKSSWIEFLQNLTSALNIDQLAVLLWLLLLFAALLFSVKVVFHRHVKRRLVLPIAVTIVTVSFLMVSFLARAYEDQFRRGAVVMAKEAECRFEPFDQSTAYFKVRTGDKVFVLVSRESWSKIRRPDGKMAWIKNDAIQLI